MLIKRVLIEWVLIEGSKRGVSHDALEPPARLMIEGDDRVGVNNKRVLIEGGDRVC